MNFVCLSRISEARKYCWCITYLWRTMAVCKIKFLRLFCMLIRVVNYWRQERLRVCISVKRNRYAYHLINFFYFYIAACLICCLCIIMSVEHNEVMHLGNEVKIVKTNDHSPCYPKEFGYLRKFKVYCFSFFIHKKCLLAHLMNAQ